MSYLPNKDFFTEVALGLVPGYSIMKGLGEREGMKATATGEDLWRGNDLSPALTDSTKVSTPDQTTGDLVSVVSEKAADNGVTPSTGVLTIRIHYLTVAGAEATVDVTMNGTTIVNIPAIYMLFIQDAYALTVGSNGVAEGNIRIYKTGDADTVYNMIGEGGNKSMVPHRMVPAGKSLVGVEWNVCEAQGKRCAFRIRSTDMYGVLIKGVFCFKGVAYLKQTSSPAMIFLDKIPAMSIIKVSGWPDQDASEASCTWHGILKDD